MRLMVASAASGSEVCLSCVLYFSRKARASSGSEEAPFSLAIIFQVAKSARARVSARRAISMSAALIKIASAPFFGSTSLFGAVSSREPVPASPANALCVAGDHEKQLDHKAGRFPQYRRNNIK